MRWRGEELTKVRYAEARYLSDIFRNPVSIGVIGNDKAIIVTWSMSPVALLIKSKSINEGIKTYLNAMWELAKP